MTVILALSDTRLVDGHLHSEIVKLTGEADLVLHAGDYASQAAYDALKKACKKDLWAVYGDLDPKDAQKRPLIRDSNGNLLPKTKSGIVDYVRICLENIPFQQNDYSESELMKKTEEAGVDLMVFGHFNKPIIAWGKKDDGALTPSSHIQLLVCPGSSSTFKSSFTTAVRINIFAGKINSVELIRIPAISYQNGWLLCSKCQGLFYGTNAGESICPEGGMHTSVIRIPYSLARDPNASGQTGWRRCKKCQALFFGPNIEKSVCHGKEKHDLTGSLVYTLIHNNPNAPGQENWRWCKKCQGLFYLPNIEKSNCPAGDKHVNSGSGKYTIESQ
jgi:predicted phosphodiesterase